MVDRDSPIPIYFQLTCHFKQLIEAGSLAPGDRLPTEMELCKEFGVSRAPVRRALTDLAREGYIYRRAGQGSFVASTLSLPQDEKIHINLLTHRDIRWMASIEQAIFLWNQLHPEQQVRLDSVMCSRSEFHQVLRRRVAQGKAPDIVPMDCVWIKDYATAGYIVPIDGLDRGWAARLSKGLEPVVAQSNTVNGHLYAIPVQTDITGLWYRRDWFAEAGVNPPATWDEWLQIIDHFADPQVKAHFGNKYAVALPVGLIAGESTVNLLLPFLWSAGANLSGSARAWEGLEDPSVHQSFEFLRQVTLKRRSYLPPNMADLGWWNFPSLLAKGEVPMLIGGTYEWPRIQEESDWDDERQMSAHLGFSPVPRPSAASSPTVSLGGTSWAILEQSSVHEISLEILKLAASVDFSMVFCTENLQISPHRVVNRDLQDAERHPWLASIVPLLRYARLRPMVANYMQISTVLQEMVERVLWKGASVEETTSRTAQLLALLFGFP
ncbi:MAG: extracellular solute-binding protein [Anaerolineae bacterium]|nr:extracellular solute-binding protein [Anaerolineae bacterium]